MSERPSSAPAAASARYGRYLAAIAVVAVVAFTIATAVGKQHGLTGIPVGQRIPPFAAPRPGGPAGDVDVAKHADEGLAGKVAACAERGPGVLNVCQLYEEGPLVLALFIDAGSCPAVLSDMQALSSSFPQVRFAAVALKASSDSVARLVRSRGLAFPVGLDRDGVLAGLYKLSTCPQLTFVYPGGVVQSKALLSRPARSRLRERVSALLQAAHARGWRPRRS
jgi:hypothetical protein